jgi:hypothetical protein
MFDFSSERVTRSVDESLQRLQLGISFFFFIPSYLQGGAVFDARMA